MNKLEQLHTRVVDLEIKAQKLRWTLLDAQRHVNTALEQLDKLGYEIVKEHEGIDQLFYPDETNPLTSWVRDRWDSLRFRLAW